MVKISGVEWKKSTEAFERSLHKVNKLSQIIKLQVDLSRKRSRPNSDASTIESNESGSPAEGNGKKDTLDSYTRW